MRARMGDSVNRQTWLSVVGVLSGSGSAGVPSG